MEKLINVYTGFRGREPIAKISGDDVGISPRASYCTPYVIHNAGSKCGYVGHYDNGASDLPEPSEITQSFEIHLTPIINDLGSTETLDIVVAGTEITSFIEIESERAKQYQYEIRQALTAVLRKHFPSARLHLRFNDDSSQTHCLLYIPRLDFIEVLEDDDAWRDRFKIK